jgi:NOL1/NOP2/fmu family ribosome biogenesis protein
LEERPVFTTDPAWHAGAYYVQEASSMIIRAILAPYISAMQPVHALDLCAAPGGKSTHLLSFLPEGSSLLSNEIDKSRFQILKENSIKWGHPCHAITCAKPKDFQRVPGVFDLIVVDAPCSGEGMFRKDEQAISHWSQENVQLCQHRQLQILEDILPALKPGGLLLYSTCTYNEEENEEVGDWLIKNHKMESLSISVSDSWGFEKRIKHNTETLVAYPNKVRGEGFACQLFRKSEGEKKFPSYNKPMRQKKEKTHDFTKYLSPVWSAEPLITNYSTRAESWYALPERAAVLNQILDALQWPPEAGICIGSWKGSDFIPHHHLACSLLNLQEFDLLEIDRKGAIEYLKGQNNFEPLGERKTKWALLCFEKQHLGWIKWAGNRFNNYYPKQFRIRNQHL